MWALGAAPRPPGRATTAQPSSRQLEPDHSSHLRGVSKKSLRDSRSYRFSSLFSSKNFVASVFMFRFITHLC